MYATQTLHEGCMKAGKMASWHYGGTMAQRHVGIATGSSHDCLTARRVATLLHCHTLPPCHPASMPPCICCPLECPSVLPTGLLLIRPRALCVGGCVSPGAELSVPSSGNTTGVESWQTGVSSWPALPRLAEASWGSACDEGRVAGSGVR